MADAIISRKEARAQGLKHYFTGMPCKRGHIDLRTVAAGRCVPCHREIEMARYRADPDAHRARGDAWRARNSEWCAANYQRQREKITTDPARAEAVRQQIRKFRQANPHKSAAYVRKRQAAQLQRTPAWLTKFHYAAMTAFYDEAARITAETGIPHEVDHIVPLLGEGVCGLHVPWNLQILSRTANRSKGNKHVD